MYIKIIAVAALTLAVATIVTSQPLYLTADASHVGPTFTLVAGAAADTPIEHSAEPAIPNTAKVASAHPTLLSIPSINVDSTVVPMGTNAKGELDVPSGATDNVGWYAKGPKPGAMGSAVMDAHVFAAFSRLHEVDKGDRIVVAMSDGTKRTFAVEKTRVYKLGDLSPQELFGRKDGRYLHLITCAGSPTADGSTYTHRLVVYATLVA